MQAEGVSYCFGGKDCIGCDTNSVFPVELHVDGGNVEFYCFHCGRLDFIPPLEMVLDSQDEFE